MTHRFIHGRVYFKCLDNYTLNPQTKMLWCNEMGVWVGGQLPECIYSSEVTNNQDNMTCPGVNFIKILRMNFLNEYHFCTFFYVQVTREKLLKQCSYKKIVHKMLMKLTIIRCNYNHTHRKHFSIQFCINICHKLYG
jgi:hypothetical protein